MTNPYVPGAPAVQPDATAVAAPHLALLAAQAAARARQAQQGFSADSAQLVSPNAAGNLSQSDREQIATMPKHGASGQMLALPSLGALNGAEDAQAKADQAARRSARVPLKPGNPGDVLAGGTSESDGVDYHWVPSPRDLELFRAQMAAQKKP